MTEKPVRPSDTGGFPVEVLDHTVAVRLSGEMDMARAHSLDVALSDALDHASAAKPVTVDFGRLTFCDSTGLNALLKARSTAQKDQIEIRLTGLNPQVHRLLEITGTLPLFAIEA